MVDRDMFCFCGEYQRGKAGTTVTDGVERCNKCRKPVEGAGGAAGRAAVAAAAAAIVQTRMISTLAEVPGFRVIATRGVVTELASASGFTASSKGSAALGSAMAALGRSAASLGANAIVGFSASSFGAAGGITSAFGGDAVGILLVGTAVLVEPISVPTGSP